MNFVDQDSHIETVSSFRVGVLCCVAQDTKFKLITAATMSIQPFLMASIAGFRGGNQPGYAGRSPGGNKVEGRIGGHCARPPNNLSADHMRGISIVAVIKRLSKGVLVCSRFYFCELAFAAFKDRLGDHLDCGRLGFALKDVLIPFHLASKVIDIAGVACFFINGDTSDCKAYTLNVS
jgi:hypothetical protein